MSPKDKVEFPVVICGSDFEELNIPEIAQTIRMLYPKAKLIYAIDKVDGFDRKLWVKNGFDEVFLLPLDQSLFTRSLGASIAEAEESLYAPVRLVDIGAGTQLDFEIRIFLNRNNKYISYSNIADVLDESRLERLKIYQVKDVFIPVKQLQKYYDFSSQRLSDLRRKVSDETEPDRKMMLMNSCRELLNSMLSEYYTQTTQPSKKIFDHTKVIIDQFLALNYSIETKSRILSLHGKKSVKFSARVPYYAILFALALEVDFEHPRFEKVGLAAARFDELTRIEAQQAPLSLEQALRTMSNETILPVDQMQTLHRMFEKEAFQHIA